MFKPQRILPALVTPFSDDGKRLNEEALQCLIYSCIQLGVSGVVPCGETGEFFNLTTNERKKVIDVVMDEVDGKVKVIVGTGADRINKNRKGNLKSTS